ncbi:hypothetical protein KUL152_02430 [Tenacibaculum sp. KUL152]|nr:hypothetical protein KUL152_02430 [Tenacibaculum sp. KUL152]
MSDSREFSGLILNRVKKEKAAQKADKKEAIHAPFSENGKTTNLRFTSLNSRLLTLFQWLLSL